MFFMKIIKTTKKMFSEEGTINYSAFHIIFELKIF